jgi:hypothetical protein
MSKQSVVADSRKFVVAAIQFSDFVQDIFFSMKSDPSIGEYSIAALQAELIGGNS